MKRITTIAFLTMTLMLAGCGNKALDNAKAAVETYNAKASTVNEQIETYNTSVKEIASANELLEKAVDVAQNALNGEDKPYDESTTESLKSAMTEAIAEKVSIPDELELFEILNVVEDAKSAELNELTTRANEGVTAIDAFEIPNVEEAPDYTKIIENIEIAQKDYENSVQSQRQITAPEDDFVIRRLQAIDTIIEIEAVTEDHDPNGRLGKQGGYIGCIYFSDNQVDRSQLYIEAGKDNVIDVGTQGGGAIEIFSTVEDAEGRNAYLGGFDNTGFSSGSHYVLGTTIIRTSDELTASQQNELTERIKEELLRVE